MKNEDRIYKDKKFEIYIKDSGIIGTFIPLDCLELIEIIIEELKKWHNLGFLHKKDSKKVIDLLIEKLRKVPR